METDTYLYSAITQKILGVLFRVHNHLGNSYQEKYYQRAVEEEFTNQKILFERERKVPILYGTKKIGYHSLDFVIEKKVVLELKAVPRLSKKDEIQTLGYMNYLQLQIGLLANFRTIRLEYKRLYLPDRYLSKEKL